MFCQAGTAETAEGSALAERERRWKVGTEPGLVFEAFSPNENSCRSSENLTASLKFKLCFGQDVWTFRPLQSSLLRWKYCLILWRLKKNRKQARDGGFFLFKLLYLYLAPNCQNANTKEHWYWFFCDIHPVKVKHLYNVFQYFFFFILFFLQCCCLFKQKDRYDVFSADPLDSSFWGAQLLALCAQKRNPPRGKDNGHTNKSPSKKIPEVKALV